MKKITNSLIILLLMILTSCISTQSQLEKSYISLSRNVLPSVVEIISVGINSESNDKWKDFFHDQEDFKKEDLNTGVGSGVISHKDGNKYFIITNRHVVGDLEKVSVLLYNNDLLDGDVIGYDDRFDLAVVVIESELNLKVAKLSKSGSLQVGQFVAALGSPMSYVQSVSMGIISNLGRFGGPKENLSNYIQTDAAINHGNSGGPLVNMRGEVIGINTWISSPTSGNIGLGFAMPIENIYPSFISIVETGKVRIGWLGVSTYGIPDTQQYKGYKGAFVNQVVIDSPAYNIGIKPGDLIIKVNDYEIRNSEDMFLRISLLKPDDIAKISIIRYSDNLEFSVYLGESNSNVLETSKNVFPGFVLVEKDSRLNILQILPKSAGLIAGFKKGDIIKKVNGFSVTFIDQFYSNIKKGSNLVTIERESKDLEIELNY